MRSEQRVGIAIGSHHLCIEINLEGPISYQLSISDMPKVTSTNQATLLLQKVAYQSASSWLSIHQTIYFVGVQQLLSLCLVEVHAAYSIESKK